MEGAATMLPFPSQPAKAGRKPTFGGRHANWDANRGGVNARLPDALYNDFDPTYQFKSEKPMHRTAVALCEQGYTINEIAAATGCSRWTVKNIVRQPHARQRMIENAQKDVSQEIKDFLEGEVLTNLRVMKEIRDDPNVKPETRLLAADKLTDRQMGRPSQPFSLPAGGKKSSEMTDAEIDEALRATGFNPAVAATAAVAGTEA